MELGIVLVGSGSIAQTHAQAIQASDKVRLVGVTGGSRAAKFAEDFGCRHYSSLEAALIDDEVMAIDICGPSGARAEATEKAAAAGRHVLVEKPIEVTLERADRMIDACRKHDVKLGVIFQSRFKQVYQVLTGWLQQGKFGRPTLADAYIKWHRPQSYYDSGGWRGTWQLDGGGALMNQGIHTIDLLRWIMGDVKTLFGMADTLARNIEVEDTAAAAFRFESGALGVIEGTTSSYPGSARRLELRGDKGTAVVVDDRLVEAEFEDMTDADKNLISKLSQGEDTGSSSDPKVANFRWHQLQIEDFADAIGEDRDPLVTGADARKTLELVLAVYKSSRSGKPVQFPLDPRSLQD